MIITTLSAFKANVESLINSLEHVEDGALPDTSCVDEIFRALNHSPTLWFAGAPMHKFEIGLNIYNESDGLAATVPDILANLRAVWYEADGLVKARENAHNEAVWIAKSNLVTRRRQDYIASLSGEVVFDDWANWLCGDPFWNVAPECEWTPEPLSGECGELSGYADAKEPMSEERKDEIRARWAELGEVSDDEVDVPVPCYVDFDDEFMAEPWSIDVDETTIEYLKGAMLAEVFRDRDHTPTIAAIGKQLAKLQSYNEGPASERGKKHSAALRDVMSAAIPRVLPMIGFEGPAATYRMSGGDDPLLAKLREMFAGLVEFEFSSDRRFRTKTTIFVDECTIVTEEDFSLLSLS